MEFAYNLKELIDTLNSFIKKTYNADGVFIPHYAYKTHNTFKGFRHYVVGLYYVVNNKTTPIIEQSFDEKYTEETKELVETKVKLQFLELIYDWIASDEFKDLMYGRISV